MGWINSLVTYANTTFRLLYCLPCGEVDSETVFDAIREFSFSICFSTCLTPRRLACSPSVFCPTIVSCSFQSVSQHVNVSIIQDPWTIMHSLQALSRPRLGISTTSFNQSEFTQRHDDIPERIRNVTWARHRREWI